MAAGLWLAAGVLGGCDDGRSVDPPGDSGPPPAPVMTGHLELIAEADAVHTVEVDVDCGPGFEHTYAIETRVRGVAGELGDRIVPAPLGMCRVQARLAEPGWQCVSEPVDVEVVEGLTGVWLTLLCRAPDDGAINVTVEVIELNRFGVPRFEPDKLIRQCGFTDVTLPVERNHPEPYTLELEQDGGPGRVGIEPLGDDAFRVTCLEAPPGAPWSVPLVARMTQFGAAHEIPLHVLCVPGEGQGACDEVCSPADAAPIEVTPFATAPDLPPACALDGAATVLAAAGAPTAGPSGCRLDVEPMDLSSLVADPATVLTAVICRDAPADAAPLPVDLYLGRDPELVRATVQVAPGCAPYPLAGAEFEAAPEANGEWDPRAVEEAFLVLQPGRHAGPATIRLLALRQRCCPGSINGCGECGDEPVELCNGADDDCDLRVDEAFPALGEGCAAGEGACRADGALVCAEDGRAVVCDAEPVPPEAVQPEVGDPEACNHYDGTDEQRDDCLRADQLCQGEHLASWCSRRASGVGDRDNRYYRWGLRQARARWPACETWRLTRTHVPDKGWRKAWICEDPCMPYYWVTPLALRLPGAGPIRFARGPAAHRFDLAGDGRSDPILWPRVMWIVRMPAAGEELTSAHLFGSNTLGGWWTDGFAALRATVPGAEDGRLTAAEAAAAGVGIWIDHDMNRRADDGEVLPLAAFGVASIETHAADQERLWWAPEGYVQGQADAPLSDGGTARVVDVHLATPATR